MLGYVGQHGGADEPRPLGKGEPMSPQARERSFDELARGLASGSISRGRALKLMGAALVGGVLASMPGIAQAAACPPDRPVRCGGPNELPGGCCHEFRPCCRIFSPGVPQEHVCCPFPRVCC